MSIAFFGVGFILFSIYLILLIWNIIYNGKKQKEENYPNINIKEKEYLLNKWKIENRKNESIERYDYEKNKNINGN